MKRNISDILDSYRDSSVELECTAPLSSQRIKELTMKKIKKNHVTGRLGMRLLIAAAIISVLTMTVFASEHIFRAGDTIRELFEKNLSENQVEVMNTLGGDFQPQTVTSEGTTMTLAAAYGDEHALYLYFQVEGPEGSVLPDGITYDFYDYSGTDWNVIEIPEGNPYKKVFGVSAEITPLPDEDPTDNRKNFSVAMYAQDGQKARFNDGVSKLYHITGIYEQVPDVNQDEDGYERLIPGSFVFDIGLVNEMSMVELDVDGLTYGGKASRTWTCGFEQCGEFCEGLETDGRVHTEYWEYHVTVKRLAISPISAEWEIAYEISDDRKFCELAFEIVMKDGTRIDTIFAHGGNSENAAHGVCSFAMPVDLAEIDYILIGDEEMGQTHKIYLPVDNES